MKKQKPHGNVARFWYKQGLMDVVSQLRTWAWTAQSQANAMASEYDDPEALHAIADSLRKAANEFETRARRVR